jgi:hypothetical protein
MKNITVRTQGGDILSSTIDDAVAALFLHLLDRAHGNKAAIHRVVDTTSQLYVDLDRDRDPKEVARGA